MKVERKPHMIERPSRYGTVQQSMRQDIVYVNGVHAGYVPTDGGPFDNVFHPLSGFPAELCPDVVDVGGFAGHLAAPVNHKTIIDDDDEMEDE